MKLTTDFLRGGRVYKRKENVDVKKRLVGLVGVEKMKEI
jgi:hypothetical protein